MTGEIKVSGGLQLGSFSMRLIQKRKRYMSVLEVEFVDTRCFYCLGISLCIQQPLSS